MVIVPIEGSNDEKNVWVHRESGTGRYLCQIAGCPAACTGERCVSQVRLADSVQHGPVAALGGSSRVGLVVGRRINYARLAVSGYQGWSGIAGMCGLRFPDVDQGYRCGLRAT